MPLNATVDDLYYANIYSADFEKQLRELPYIDDFGRASGRPGQSSGTYGFQINNDINKPVTIDVCECDFKAFENTILMYLHLFQLHLILEGLVLELVVR